MKALVTGGAGFIGSNLIKLLVEQNVKAIVIDNLSSGYICNIAPYIAERKVEFVGGDIRDSIAVDKAMNEVDVVFHLAASVGRQRSIDNPQLDSEINVIGTINVLEAMRRNGVKRIVYSSSAAIFGELMYPTIDELHPQNADCQYGVSKLAAEKMILAYSGLYGIEGICLRYFNIYGINQRFDLYGNVIPIFAHKIFTGEPITIYGDGSQTRDFVNAQDVARANLIAASCNVKTDVFNVGSGTSISIDRLADIMQSIAGINVGINYAPWRIGDVKHCKANANKICEVLGYTANVQLEDGLAQYMNWYKTNCV